MGADSNVESNAVFFNIQLQHQSMLIANGIAIIAFLHFLYTQEVIMINGIPIV